MSKAVLDTGPLRLIASHSTVITACAPVRLYRGDCVALTGHDQFRPTHLARALAGHAEDGEDLEGPLVRDGLHLWLAGDGALFPDRSLGEQIDLLLGHHLAMGSGEARRTFMAACQITGLDDARQHLSRTADYLDEQHRWRALLAMAIACRPSLLALACPDQVDSTLKNEMLRRLSGWARERENGKGCALLVAGCDDLPTSFADRTIRLDGNHTLNNDPTGIPASPVHASDSNKWQHAPADQANRLVVQDLSVTLDLGGNGKGGRFRLTVVSGVSFELAAGQTMALIGESGGGKAMLSRALVRLGPISQGLIRWRGEDVLTDDKSIQERHRQQIRFLFADPVAALNPALTIGAQLALTAEQASPFMATPIHLTDSLAEIGLPEQILDCYPADIDKASAARIGLARALLSDPRLLVCDDPAACLYGDARRDFLNLLSRIQRQRGLSLILATGRLDQAAQLTDQAMVLMAGRVIESAPVSSLVNNACHPYSRALARATINPQALPDPAAPAYATGERVSPLARIKGCQLVASCALARPFCRDNAPPLEEVAVGHRVACHYWDTQ